MHKLRQLKRGDWPPLINLIADVIGDDAALTLFIRFAGQHLRPPLKKCPPNHIIEQTIGKEKAALLCKTFGGEMLVFPNGRLLLIKERNRQIMEDWSGGMMQRDIANLYQLTERQINKIINVKKGEKQ